MICVLCKATANFGNLWEKNAKILCSICFCFPRCSLSLPTTSHNMFDLFFSYVSIVSSFLLCIALWDNREPVVYFHLSISGFLSLVWRKYVVWVFHLIQKALLVVGSNIFTPRFFNQHKITIFLSPFNNNESWIKLILGSAVLLFGCVQYI